MEKLKRMENKEPGGKALLETGELGDEAILETGEAGSEVVLETGKPGDEVPLENKESGSAEKEEAKDPNDTNKPEPTSITNPHDKGYKKSLSKPAEFLHFLKKYVKADWMMQLEESDLVLCDKEMLEHDYEGKEADLIYRVNMPDGKTVYIFILQELQSYVDYTMIFRILVYVVNTLVKHFLDVDKKEREKVGFRLPAMIPIVFYNGLEKWTAATSMRSYQNSGEIFGDYILDLKYYLVDLAKLDEEYILSTNTVLDNIMYCDKFRKRMELAGAVRTAYSRVQGLGLQEQEEFRNWVKYILLSVCDNKVAVAEEILSWVRDGEGDMAFEYTIIRCLKEEREEMRAEVKAEVRAEMEKEVKAEVRAEMEEEVKAEVRAEMEEEVKAEVRAEVKAETRTETKVEDILAFLEEVGTVPEALKQTICAQKDLDILSKWVKMAARSETIEEFGRKMRETLKSDE